VDCYPGSRLCHAIDILAGITTPFPEVTRVILAFGMSNRISPPHINYRQAGALFSVATKVFPAALIQFPLLNLDYALPKHERDILTGLNLFMFTHMPTIPFLPTHLFQTSRDHVHWTAPTARAIQEHWSLV